MTVTEHTPAPVRRLVIAGTTGSGKTTIARRAATIIGGEHVELDALWWGPNWTPVDLPLFRERVARAIEAPRWVLDGGYASHIYDVAWVQADVFVWLDYWFPLVFTRLLRRTFSRRLRNEDLWSGNREQLGRTFMSKDSILLWAVKSHFKYHRTYVDYFRRPELAHVRFVRVTTPAAMERFLSELSASSSQPSA